MDNPDLHDCVRKVANGEIPLAPSGVELRHEHPGLPNSEKIVSENNKTFRIVAEVIVDRFQRLGKWSESNKEEIAHPFPERDAHDVAANQSGRTYHAATKNTRWQFQLFCQVFSSF